MICPTCGHQCNPLPLSKLLRTTRKLAKMKPEDLADRLGVTEITVKRWESGRCVPQVRQWKRIEDWIEGKQ